MRPSPNRHPLAVLRNSLDIGQKEMADLVGRSRRTIQGIELKTMPLSEGLAERIAHETWVSAQWLMDGDPQAEPWLRNHKDIPYRKEHYERLRLCFLRKEAPTVEKIVRGIFLPLPPPDKPLAHLSGVLGENIIPEDDRTPFFPEIFGRIFSAFYAAEQSGRGELAFHKLARFADAMKGDYGQYGDPKKPGDPAARALKSFCHDVLLKLIRNNALMATVYTPAVRSADLTAPSNSLPTEPTPPSSETVTASPPEPSPQGTFAAALLARDLEVKPPRVPRW